MTVMGGMVYRMSEQTNEHIPVLTLGWRLKMALGPMAAHDMADALEVHRATVARWMSDRGTPPRSVFVKQWALITRTDPGWLLTGQRAAPHPGEPGEGQGLDTRGKDAFVLPFHQATAA